MTPEMAFSHPFIAKAVNELKCLRTGSQGNSGSQAASAQGANSVGQQPQDTQSRNPAATARTSAKQQQSQNTVKSNVGDTKGSNGQSATISQGANSARSNNQGDSESGLPRINR